MLTGGPFGGLAFVQVMLGIALVLLGVLVILVPQLLAWAVGIILIMAGAGIAASAHRLRQQITYRRLDTWMNNDDDRTP